MSWFCDLTSKDERKSIRKILPCCDCEFWKKVFIGLSLKGWEGEKRGEKRKKHSTVGSQHNWVALLFCQDGDCSYVAFVLLSIHLPSLHPSVEYFKRMLFLSLFPGMDSSQQSSFDYPSPKLYVSIRPSVYPSIPVSAYMLSSINSTLVIYLSIHLHNSLHLFIHVYIYHQSRTLIICIYFSIYLYPFILLCSFIYLSFHSYMCIYIINTHLC